jgi:DNA-binding MarR family transcriptional regulator
MPAPDGDGAGAGATETASSAPLRRGVRDSDLAGVDEEEVAARLRVALTRLHRRLRLESLAGVSPAQASALASIHRMGRPTLGELAQAEQVQPPSVTHLVAAMESAGLLTRLSDPDDRRVSRVELTPLGRDTLERIRTLKNAYLSDRLAALAPTDRRLARSLTGLLERLVGE